MKTLFVTATGTDVGKTHVACAKLNAARAAGQKVHALKPVITGWAELDPPTSDTGLLLTACGQPVTDETINAITPWRFSIPLSPDMAAARDGQTLDFERVVAWCQDQIGRAEADGVDLMLIEGAGGALVPMDATHTMRDFAKALDIPALLIAGTYLGTISHTLTAVEALERGGVSIDEIVLSESESQPVPPSETRQTLTRFLPDHTITILPRS